MKRKQRILTHYEPRIGTGRENFDVLDWASAASQQARFGALGRSVALSGKSLLDVGSGLGDLLGYLRAHDIEVDYTGIDISPKMVRAARQLHQGARFFCADLFTDGEASADRPLGRTTFDLVYCSGVFNLNLGNNSQFLPNAVARLMDLAGEHVVFNLLDNRTPYQDDHYAYYDPAEVLTSISASRWESRIVDGYLPNDFTVICRKTGLDAIS